MSHFHEFDLDEFWDQSDYARKTYQLPAPTRDAIAAVERTLGYRLPASFVELMQHQNGGIPANTAYPTTEPTSWAEDHVAISGIMGIGGSKAYSLCGELGSRFMIAEWEYPPIGVYFGDCPSAGHDMICLDYRECGPTGEPRVAHVDQELDYRVTHLADNFHQFVTGLISEDSFADPDDDGSTEFVWRTDAIKAEILRDDEFLANGQYLNLEQNLPAEMMGWLSMKVNTPERWDVTGVAVGDGLVRLKTADHGSYVLTRNNVGQLSYDLLSGGDDKSDDLIEAIWSTHARDRG